MTTAPERNLLSRRLDVRLSSNEAAALQEARGLVSVSAWVRLAIREKIARDAEAKS